MYAHISQHPPASAQRISQQFYDSEPLYSDAPPPLPVTEPPPVMRSRARGVLAKLLFAAVFLPTVALLVMVLMHR